MPTLPLFDRLNADRPDACHRVRAPGGYEWWRFDAQDHAARIHVTTTFFQGHPFHPQYVRRYFAYEGRPTRCRPPQPAEYPAVHLAIYDNGTLLAQATTQYPPAMFQAAPNDSGIAIGPSQFAGSSEALTVYAQGIDESLGIDLIFRDRLHLPATERTSFPRQMTGAEHCWIMENPLCDVMGQIRLPGKRAIDLAGVGHHDHCYGGGPIGPGFTRWMRGRVFLLRQALAFQMATPRSPEFPETACLLRADQRGTREISMGAIRSSWDRKTSWNLAYPSILDIGQDLLLRRPRLLGASAFSVHAEFDAYVDGKQATAFCEIAYPGRLRTPLLGRWIERAIRRGA